MEGCGLSKTAGVRKNLIAANGASVTTLIVAAGADGVARCRNHPIPE
jgi:hypothetical protein